jgi:NTP pyrophosphatase (non-canonical NTP hydrolase)
MIKQETIDRIIQFRNDRDWAQFHTLKDLSLGLGIEVAELQEFFLWKTNQELSETIELKSESIGDELADIFIFLTYLSNDLGIDLNKAVNKKIDKNANKYPLEKSKGNNKKYNEL